MNKAELIEAAAQAAGISKRQAHEAVNSVFQSIQSALKKGKRVQIIGFGSFLVRKRKARAGRNPKTGAVLQIPARKVPAFSAGAELKKAVK
jgi:DNA-binding protein HU-beta